MNTSTSFIKGRIVNRYISEVIRQIDTGSD